VHAKVQVAKEQMVENVDKALEKSDKLENTMVSTQEMADGSYQFKKSTKTVKRDMFLKSLVLNVVDLFKKSD